MTCDLFLYILKCVFRRYLGYSNFEFVIAMLLYFVNFLFW